MPNLCANGCLPWSAFDLIKRSTMWRAARFALVLFVVLGLLSWAVSGLVTQLTLDSVTRDVTLRADIAANDVRPALARAIADPDTLRKVLDDLSRDERVLAAAVCANDGRPLAETSTFPSQLACTNLVAALHVHGDNRIAETRPVEGGEIHVATYPVRDVRGRRIGVLALVHDLRFAATRESETRTIHLVGFGIFTIVASLATLLAIRSSWEAFRGELRRMVLRGQRSPEFAPIAADVRELISRVREEMQTSSNHRWDADRLKSTLSRLLLGERVIVVANREPYIHEQTNGDVRVLHPASGLVTALEPVMRACSGVWVAHGSGSADRRMADAHGRVLVPPGEGRYVLRRVWLSPEEEQGYYYGYANEGLWPLCHLAHTFPVFRRSDYSQYDRVNERFADAVAQEADADDPIVLVQDYHFALAPQKIRKRLPRATIITFWHIPFPNAERFGICPQSVELLEGLLGSSIVGFHTQQHCNNFLAAVDRQLEARIDREQNGVVFRGRLTLVRPYPISIEWPSEWSLQAPPVDVCHAEIRAENGLPPNALVGVGVDRLDYTKGIPQRLLAVERLLEIRPDLRGRFTFIQLGAESRAQLGPYQALNQQIEALAARINARFGRPSNGHAQYQPVLLLRAHHEPPTVFKYYRGADFCFVSSLHDGMNLVAKEFVAARDDEQGVLVLSKFTGAAHELTEALIVNPYDLDASAQALAAALEMSPEEQTERMRAMRSLVADWNVYRWAGRMLVDASRLRLQGRLGARILADARFSEVARAMRSP
jgi:trehalose 6-phosphate synthase